MSNRRTTLDSKADALVRHKKAYLAGRGVTWVAVACLVVATAVACADVYLGLPVLARWLALATLAVVACVGLVARFLVPSLHFHKHEAIREMEEGKEGVGQMLRTSDEVSHLDDVERVGFSRGGMDEDSQL